MHASISSYLTSLADKGRSPLTIKAARGDLIGFAAWWDSRYSRPFDPALLRTSDLQAWRLARQKDDAAAPATINRALVTLRAYCDWAKDAGLITENPVEAIKAIPTSQPAPKSLPAEAVDAILRAVRGEKDDRIRLRDEALLALLIYTGLRAQETCDVQIRDLDLDGGMLTVRHGKGGRMRRVMLNADAIALLRRYILRLRCPGGLPALGTEREREPLLVGFDSTKAGRPMQPGVNQRLVQRVVVQRAHEAAQRLRTDTEAVSSLERVGVMLDLAQRLEGRFSQRAGGS
jgi:site-specific recombinase XerD